MEDEKNGLATDECTEDEFTYIQYKKQKQTELLEADEELKRLVSEQRANKGESEEDEKEAENKIREYLKTHNEGKENNEYLVRGAELQCSCGSHTRKLNLNTCHGVYMKGHPVVHELDCASGEGKNITWFGVCDHENFESEQIIVMNQDGSKKCGLKCNPKLIGVWIDSYEGTKIVDNSYKIFAKRFGPEFKLPQLDGPVILKNAEDGEKSHMPQLNLSHDLIQIDRFKENWSMDNGDDTEDTLEGYACNVLTVGSFLVCQHGGIISPVNSGQDRTVELTEFSEGWNAYRRVMEYSGEELLMTPEKRVGISEDGMTETYNRIKELASKWDIDYTDVKWTTADLVYWKTIGKAAFLHNKKVNFISQYKDVIADAAKEYELPELLVAGIVYNEYGGDPMWADEVAYSIYSFDWSGPDWVDENLTITKNPDLVSFGNVSIQVRRAWECLGYDNSEVTPKTKSQIINSLRNPVENIYISAKHLSDLRDIQYPDLTADNASNEEILILGTRYNRGPNISLERLLEDSSYGKRILDNAEALEEAMKYENKENN